MHNYLAKLIKGIISKLIIFYIILIGIWLKIFVTLDDILLGYELLMHDKY